MEQAMMRLMLPAIVVAVAVLQLLTPRLTRPELWFSVTVPVGFRDTGEARRMFRTYRWQVVAHAIIGLGLTLAGLWPERPVLLVAGVLWQVVGATVAFLVGHQQALPHAVAPSPIREAQLVRRRDSLPGGPLLQAGPFAIVALSGLWLALHWQQLPERFPTHWGFDGQPNAWVARTPAALFGNLGAGALVCAGLVALGYGILRSRRIQASGAAGAGEQRFRAVSLGILLGAEYLVAFACSVPGLFAVVGDASVPLAAISLGVMALLAATLGFFVSVGQGGARHAGAAAAGHPPPVGDRTADSRWKWGLLYVDAADPAIFVEKRFGFGYTLNFGNRRAWLIILALVALTAALMMLGGRPA